MHTSREEAMALGCFCFVFSGLSAFYCVPRHRTETSQVHLGKATV